MIDNWLIHDKIDTTNFISIIDKLIYKKDSVNTELKNLSPKGNIKQFIFDNKIPDTILKKVKEKTTLLLKKELNKDIQLKLLNSWTVIGNKNSYHFLHRHNTDNKVNHISTVIYLKVVEKGNFYFILTDYENKNNQVYEITPIENMIIVMPSSVYHGSYPQSEGIRQTLNLDFEMKEKKSV